MLKDTIISAFNYDGTLLKWLKKVEDALQNASASEFRVNKKGNATISFSIVFANGDTLESGDIVLQQGESVTGATIRQGHLILTLSNGNELDAGDIGAVTGFSINDSQHLIVTYQNGTTQDLGAIFNGATINVNTLTSNNEEISTLKPIVEDMTGYSYVSDSNIATPIYVSACKNGNKLTIVWFGTITPDVDYTHNDGVSLGYLTIPAGVWNKLYPYTQASYSNMLDIKTTSAYYGVVLKVPNESYTLKASNYMLNLITRPTIDKVLTAGTTYFIRYEATFLLSENLAQ